MTLALNIDFAQPDFQRLLAKDISDNTDYQLAFPPAGKASAFAFGIILESHKDSIQRHFIRERAPAIGTTLLPETETTIFYHQLVQLSAQQQKTGFILESPINTDVLMDFPDAVYKMKYWVGAQVSGTTLLANTVYYSLNTATISSQSVPASSKITVGNANVTFAAGNKFSKADYETNGLLLISSKMKGEYAKALIRGSALVTRAQKTENERLLNSFRVNYDRLKALVIVDSFTEAAEIFEECNNILHNINNLT